MVRFGTMDAKSEDDYQGFKRPLPGRYHVLVKEAQEKSAEDLKADQDKVVIEFEVLAGTVPGQEGLTTTEFFTISEKALPRLKRFALCVGLIKPGEPERDVQFEECVGRDLVIELIEKKSNKDGKTYINIDYMGMWSTGNKEVQDVPKCTDFASRQDIGHDAGQTTQQEAMSSATSSPTPSSQDKWADL